MNNNRISISQPIVSMTDMAKMLQMSRARFYQLLGMGFFPQPVYDIRSKRPCYDRDMQEKCIECRQSGIGIDGSFMLFYSPRKKERVSDLKKTKIDPQVKEMTETLQTMGLGVSIKQVQQGLSELYPDGITEQDQGLVIRELFRYLKSK